MEVPLVARAAEMEPRTEPRGASGASHSPQDALACSAPHASVAARPTERLAAGRRCSELAAEGAARLREADRLGRGASQSLAAEVTTVVALPAALAVALTFWFQIG
eukprot:15432563-Alexandrium_andersonii.AAC.1